jgi:hypothetical protein
MINKPREEKNIDEISAAMFSRPSLMFVSIASVDADASFSLSTKTGVGPKEDRESGELEAVTHLLWLTMMLSHAI